MRPIVPLWWGIRRLPSLNSEISAADQPLWICGRVGVSILLPSSLLKLHLATLRCLSSLCLVRLIAFVRPRPNAFQERSFFLPSFRGSFVRPAHRPDSESRIVGIEHDSCEGSSLQRMERSMNNVHAVERKTCPPRPSRPLVQLPDLPALYSAIHVCLSLGQMCQYNSERGNVDLQLTSKTAA